VTGTDDTDRVVAAVDALRQGLRDAGHRFYATASDLARDRGPDAVSRASNEIKAAVKVVHDRLVELDDTLTEYNEKRNK
jgi:hypothetical protein